MKGQMSLLAMTGMLLALVQVGGSAQTKYVPKPDEEIYGTWTNDKMIEIKKIVSYPGGTKNFASISDSNPQWEVKSEITSKWSDSEGNVWYRILLTVVDGVFRDTKIQELDKISESGTKWEFVDWFVNEFSADN